MTDDDETLEDIEAEVAAIPDEHVTRQYEAVMERVRRERAGDTTSGLEWCEIHQARHMAPGHGDPEPQTAPIRPLGFYGPGS